MPRSDDSAPNFDFLDDVEPSGDSATNLLDPAADVPASDESPFAADDSPDDADHALDSSPKLDETADLTDAAKPQATAEPADKKTEIDHAEPAERRETTKRREGRKRTGSRSGPRGSSTKSEVAPDEAAANEDAPNEPASDAGEKPSRRSRGRSSERTGSRGGSGRDAKRTRSREAASDDTGGGFDWDAIVAAGGKPVVLGLASYAALTTLMLLWALFSDGPSRSTLESLPDVPPREENQFRYVPPSAAVPPGHRVAIGESERFGHIRVEPLGVTRGPVQLEHYTGASRQTPPSFGGEPLKLRLRLTNESSATASGQVIAPLDRDLMYERLPDATGQVVSNQYVYNAGQAGDPAVLLLPLATTSEWNVVGQPLDPLKPGESVETIVAAGPQNIEKLGANAVWRLQLRKGYHDATGHGVTTLVEVPFDATAVSGG